MRTIKLTLALLVVVTASGCAVGNQYSYHNVNIALPVQGSGEVGLAVVEDRADVLSGDKKPDFVGVQRATLGNPWGVSTVSGNSLVQDFSETLEIALTKSGFDVTVLDGISNENPGTAVAAVGKDRNVMLKVSDWRTDIYMNMTLFYDLTLSVLSGDGAVLASTQSQGEEKLSGASMTAAGNAKTATSALETKIARMFNDQTIRDALQ